MRRRLSAVRKLVMATFEPSSRKERIWRFSPPRATCWPPSTKQQERDEVSVFTTKSHILATFCAGLRISFDDILLC